MNKHFSTVSTADSKAPSSKISAKAQEWASERAISLETLARLGVASGTAFFPDAGKKLEGIFFKYRDGWKARPLAVKTFVAGGGFKSSFWNLDAVLRSAKDAVFIVEGEMDALALVEAGVSADQVLSVPTGAKAREADDPKAQRGYGYVQEALAEGLSAVKRFVWCGDTDGAGLALRSDMAALLGAARFWFVDWPEGIKDANDFLIKDGHDAVLDLVMDGALPWPVEGIFRLSELPEPAPLTIWEPGFPEWEKKVMLAPRMLSVVTGHGGHGKTSMWNQIWFQIVRRYGVGIAMASFETRPKPHIRRQLRTLFHNRLEWDLDDAARKQADEWIDQHYLFLVHPDQRPTLEWFLDTAEVAVIRHGIRVVQLDPWNRLEGGRGQGEGESDFIGRCLRTIHGFANDMNVHVQILAHPAKMENLRKGTAPTLEDISGSKNWENMVDQGFTVHRPEFFKDGQRQTKSSFYQRKTRFEELGYPCKLEMEYDLKTGRFKSSDYPQV